MTADIFAACVLLTVSSECSNGLKSGKARCYIQCIILYADMPYVQFVVVGRTPVSFVYPKVLFYRGLLYPQMPYIQSIAVRRTSSLVISKVMLYPGLLYPRVDCTYPCICFPFPVAGSKMRCLDRRRQVCWCNPLLQSLRSAPCFF